jgi:DinB superfamily
MDTAVREKNLALLAEGTNALLESVAGVSEEQARMHPAADRWSVLECVEHVVLAENRMFDLLAKESGPAAAVSDGSREERVRFRSVDRENKFQAPEFSKPTGRFSSLVAAVDEFRRCRARTANYLTRCEDELRARTAKHPVVGPVSCQELLIILSLHPARHAQQIREVRQSLGPA